MRVFARSECNELWTEALVNPLIKRKLQFGQFISRLPRQMLEQQYRHQLRFGVDHEVG